MQLLFQWPLQKEVLVMFLRNSKIVIIVVWQGRPCQETPWLSMFLYYLNPLVLMFKFSCSPFFIFIVNILPEFIVMHLNKCMLKQSLVNMLVGRYHKFWVHIAVSFQGMGFTACHQYCWWTRRQECDIMVQKLLFHSCNFMRRTLVIFLPAPHQIKFQDQLSLSAHEHCLKFNYLKSFTSNFIYLYDIKYSDAIQ